MTFIGAPRYPLAKLQASVRRGEYFVTRSAMEGAAEILMDENDIRNCVLSLDEGHFYKSMPSRTRPGSAQDVYRCRYMGFAVYLKLQMTDAAVIISFKRDESA